MTDAEKMPWVIFDIDGTMANISHRLHHIQGTPKDWDAFNAGICNDSIKPDILALFEMCYDSGHNIMFVTGRFNEYREATTEWLSRWGIHFPILHMRKDGDYRSDFEVKQDIYDEHIKGKNVRFAVDDRDRVVEMWRKNGVTCLQCQKGDY